MSLKKNFALRAVSGRESMSDLCREFGISRKTGHKWRERFIAYGFAGLEDLSRRPQASPNALDEDGVCRLIQLKQAHPHWGPRKLAELWRRNFDDSVPSESTIKRVLSKAGLIDKRKRRTRPEGVRLQQTSFEPTAPNDLWTVDFKGWWHCREQGRCEPLYLPPYSPDLNPIERLWQVIKREWFTDFIAKSQQQLINRLDKALLWAIDRKEQNKKTCKIAA